jgi:hypothetical protein
VFIPLLKATSSISYYYVLGIISCTLTVTVIGSSIVKLSRNSFIRIHPCGGGVDYLHRDPTSRRRRRKGKSQM